MCTPAIARPSLPPGTQLKAGQLMQKSDKSEGKEKKRKQRGQRRAMRFVVDPKRATAVAGRRPFPGSLASLSIWVSSWSAFLSPIFPRRRPARQRDGEAIIVPENSFEDPAAFDHPGGVPNEGANDPTRQSAQDRLKEIAKSEGWAQSESPQAGCTLAPRRARRGIIEAAGIFGGSGGSLGGDAEQRHG